jgi:asparagine synthase (glutamine-hydrolysing)
MADAIAYLGPDGFDVGSDAEAGVALAHRRLAIIDLTPTGEMAAAACAQPHCARELVYEGWRRRWAAP